MPKITILYDDREKKPWTQEYMGEDFIMKRTRFTVGDYSIKGLEHLVRIERKKNWEEIANNIATKVNRDNFEKELRALQAFPIRFLVINDTIDGLLSMKQYSDRITPQVIANWITHIELDYGISIIQLGARHRKLCKYMTRDMFRRMHKHNKAPQMYYHKIIEPPAEKVTVKRKKLVRPNKRK